MSGVDESGEQVGWMSQVDELGEQVGWTSLVEKSGGQVGVDQWEAWNWSCDLRANTSPQNKVHWEGTTYNIQNDGHRDLLTNSAELKKIHNALQNNLLIHYFLLFRTTSNLLKICSLRQNKSKDKKKFNSPRVWRECCRSVQWRGWWWMPPVRRRGWGAVSAPSAPEVWKSARIIRIQKETVGIQKVNFTCFAKLPLAGGFMNSAKVFFFTMALPFRQAMVFRPACHTHLPLTNRQEQTCLQLK